MCVRVCVRVCARVLVRVCVIVAHWAGFVPPHQGGKWEGKEAFSALV